jgi:hypothetical protein
MAKKEKSLTLMEVLGMLQESEQREAWLRDENALLRQRLLLHENDRVVRSLVHVPGPDGSQGELIVLDELTLQYRLPPT